MECMFQEGFSHTHIEATEHASLTLGSTLLMSIAHTIQRPSKLATGIHDACCLLLTACDPLRV